MATVCNPAPDNWGSPEVTKLLRYLSESQRARQNGYEESVYVDPLGRRWENGKPPSTTQMDRR